MEKQLIKFEGQLNVLIFFKDDVNFDFKGDFLIRAREVSMGLEYTQTNDFVNLIKPKYVYKIKNSDLAKSQNRKLNNAGEIFISNFGLNQGLSNSNMPKAEPFQDWLYEDMLPTVSKHGAYLTPEVVEKTLTDPDFIIRVATELKNERMQRIEAEKKLLYVEPKLAYLDVILKSKGTVTTTQIAKDYGLSAKELNDILHEEKVQYKQNKQWLPYSKYQDKGYTQSYTMEIVHKNGEVEVKMNTRWSQNGRLFIHDILMNRGIKPNLERDYGRES